MHHFCFTFYVHLFKTKHLQCVLCQKVSTECISVKVESMYAIILYVVKDLRVPNLYQSVQSSKIPNNPVSYLLSHPLEAEAREE